MRRPMHAAQSHFVFTRGYVIICLMDDALGKGIGRMKGNEKKGGA